MDPSRCSGMGRDEAEFSDHVVALRKTIRSAGRSRSAPRIVRIYVADADATDSSSGDDEPRRLLPRRRWRRRRRVRRHVREIEIGVAPAPPAPAPVPRRRGVKVSRPLEKEAEEGCGGGGGEKHFRGAAIRLKGPNAVTNFPAPDPPPLALTLTPTPTPTLTTPPLQPRRRVPPLPDLGAPLHGGGDDGAVRPLPGRRNGPLRLRPRLPLPLETPFPAPFHLTDFYGPQRHFWEAEFGEFDADVFARRSREDDLLLLVRKDKES
uniref:Uncharacterized protein n=1 Tax=Ananas comosus var. bracteatus TaxID=296719 RepID=A0A6V7NFZ7_ANACO|nr:unnamed protein product [Ananas comosus var. bracteatus]